MIEITNFSKKYRNTTIFTNINILLEDQKTYFVLGKNGSGKTTFLKCLLGLENYSGTISFTPLENNELFRGIISLCERVAASGNTSILLSA